MAKVNLTTNRISDFQCSEDRKQDFLWCNEVKGLAVRATAGSNIKRYIYQSRIEGKTIRLTIGKVDVWSIKAAKEEARRLQILIDKGDDPRHVKKEKAANEKAANLAKQKEEKRARLTFGEAWHEYLNARKPKWSESHYKDHLKMIRSAGETCNRSNKLTVPGLLTTFIDVRLKEVSKEMLTEWAEKESKERPTQARLALRLLRAFFNWCSEHDLYMHIAQSNPTKNKAIRETLGKPTAKDDVLQREQLSAWFSAVRQIQNPVISAYLQTVLLTGARREEILQIRWKDIDFQWKSITIHDKVDGLRVVPLTPYVSHLLTTLPRRNEWVFSSPSAGRGRLADPRKAHNQACMIAGIHLTIHGLRRSFASLCEWIECPAGIAAQIQGHKPQGVREQNYIRRPLDLLRKWHIKIEEWILQEAKIEYIPTRQGLHAVITT